MAYNRPCSLQTKHYGISVFSGNVTEFDFSNKKWDKITKELRGKDLIIIHKIDENLFIKPS